ncbi:MAG TPA: hypothetical protein VK842_00070, partial [bacterium]|nr:hypothetical protein [bacterium]
AHAAANVQHSEAEHYRLTCRKLVQECRRELDQAGLADGVDKAAAGEWLGQVGSRLESEAVDAAKATLKELNQFVLRLRMARPPAV